MHDNICTGITWRHRAEGARHLKPWRFDEFLGMVRRAAETALAVRRAVPANKPPDDRFKR